MKTDTALFQTVEAIPKPHTIHSWMNCSLGIPKALAELVDNSFDNAATQVTVTVDTTDRGQIEVVDNGRGAPPTEESALLFTQHGGSYGRPGRAGRFGVGLKESACWLGDRLDVLTCQDGIRGLHVVADWPRMMKLGVWAIQWGAKDMANRGTTVQISGLRPSAKRIHEVRRAVDQLRTEYGPGLKGRNGLPVKIRVVVNGKASTLEPNPDPALVAVVEVEGFFGALRYRARFGALQNVSDKEACSGWDICYEHSARYVCRRQRRLEMSGIWGEVALVDTTEGKWALDKNKGDFAGRDEFLEHLLSRPDVAELRERLALASHDMELKSLEVTCALAMQKAVDQLTGKRQIRRKRTEGTPDPRKRPGKVSPTDRPIVTPSFDPTQPGNVKAPGGGGAGSGRLSPELSLTLDHKGPESKLVDACLSGRRLPVVINLDHPFMRAFPRERLTIIAIGMAAAGAVLGNTDWTSKGPRDDTPDMFTEKFTERTLDMFSKVMGEVTPETAGCFVGVEQETAQAA